MFRINIWWRLHLLLHIGMLSRACDETCWVTLLRVFRWTEKEIGPTPAVSLLNIECSWKTIISHPSTKYHIFDFDQYPKILFRKRVDPGSKRPKRLKLITNKKISNRWNITDGWILKLSLDTKNRFFDITKHLWYDTSSCNITNRWMLTLSLDIQKCFLILLNLTKLSPDQRMAQIWYPITQSFYYNIQ